MGIVTSHNICPNCLRNGNIGYTCPECGTSTTNTKYRARVPRKKASKREWLEFIEKFTRYPELFALKLGRPATNEEIERAHNPPKQIAPWSRLDYLKETGALKDWSPRMEKALTKRIKQCLKLYERRGIKFEDCLFVQKAYKADGTVDGTIQVLVRIETLLEDKGWNGNNWKGIYGELAKDLQRCFKRNNPPLEFICEEGERKASSLRVLERSW